MSNLTSKESGEQMVGEKVKVKVLKYDSAKGKISLGMKQTVPGPPVVKSGETCFMICG